MLIAIGFSSVSCEDYTDDINVDPNNFTSAPGNLLIGQAELVVVAISSGNSARYGGMWSDQFTGADRQYIVTDQYGTTSGDYDDQWDDLYVNGAAQARIAKASGAEAGDALLEGVAAAMEALLIGEAAALWGDVPYRNAFDYTTEPNPTYDPQEQVFGDVQDLLSNALTLVGPDATVAAVYGAPVFVGNDAKWAEVIHSLKARYFLITKDYASAHAEALQGISSASGDLLSSHSDVIGARNLWYQFTIEERNEYLRADDSNLVKLMTGERARALATPGDAVRYDNYFIPGLEGLDLNAQPGGYFAVDASFPIISYVETKLIEAECAAQLGLDDLARAPFNEVRAHLADVWDADFPATASSGADLLYEITEEKYVSLPGSLQIYHDVRRNNNLLDVPIDGVGTTVIPQRFLYPQVEIGANANFPGLVDLYTPTPVNQ